MCGDRLDLMGLQANEYKIVRRLFFALTADMDAHRLRPSTRLTIELDAA
jgi:hypothetical protein